MNGLRKIFFPFSILYGWITDFRNLLYRTEILKRHRSELPLIVVGNLSVGGTGKTPMVEYLIRLLSPLYKTATLSRGYKRKSKGFVLANAQSTVEEIGDEPYQYHKKFPELEVAVHANRVQGVEQLLRAKPQLELILLDDAFQHLPIWADLNILLTTQRELYADDWMLPAGNLRETKKGARRAQIVIVTKCDPKITQEQRAIIRRKLKLEAAQQLFFTYITYGSELRCKSGSRAVEQVDWNRAILVAGIAKPQSFFDRLKLVNTPCLTYPDHHAFSDKDIRDIVEKAAGGLVVTTEKDYMRLEGRINADQLYYLPIQTAFVEGKTHFDQIILDYVEQHSRIRKIHPSSNP